MTTSFLILLLVALPFWAQSSWSAPPTSLCEMRDGDCPKPCHKFDNVDLTPELYINDACSRGLCKPGGRHRWFNQAADAADVGIKQGDNASSGHSNIIRFDNTTWGLHTSILYICCQHILDTAKIVRAFKKMHWNSFDVAYSDVGCNVDQHGSDVVYIHALPDAAGQANFRNLTQIMNAAMTAAGVPVHHPRKSLFHMTLARVTHKYDTDKVVEALREEAHSSATAAPFFGTVRVCRFSIAGISSEASDGCIPFEVTRRARLGGE